MRSVETRKDLTAEWDRVGVEHGVEYAILTGNISKHGQECQQKNTRPTRDLKKKA